MTYIHLNAKVWNTVKQGNGRLKKVNLYLEKNLFQVNKYNKRQGQALYNN